jgi:uncharacterized protein (DUF58 family)
MKEDGRKAEQEKNRETCLSVCYFETMNNLNNSPHLKLNYRVLSLAILLLIILQLTAPFRGWVILLVGFGGAWLVARLWVRSLVRGLVLTREVRFGWAQVGDRLEERFTLRNDSIFPALWVQILDHSTLPEYSASQATGIGGKEEHTWLVRGTCVRRGSFVLGPTILQTGDPFGIYTLVIASSAIQKMIVLPPVVPLPSIEIAPGGRLGEGRLRRANLERTVNAASVREYQPGDEMHSIHWRTSARRDALFVRLFESTPSGAWWVLLDLNARAQVGRDADSTVEHGIILAVSVAERGLRDGHPVGLVASAAQSIWLAPHNDAAHRWEILGALALAQPGSLALGDALERARPSLKYSSSLVIITPDARGSWVDALPALLWRGIVPTILLLDPISFGGTDDMRGVAALLGEFGVARHIITRDVLDRPEAKPGDAGKFDWRVTPHGRAVLRRPLRQAAWKVLA